MNGIIEKMNAQSDSRKGSAQRLSNASENAKKEQEGQEFEDKEKYYKLDKEEEWDVVSKTSEVLLDGMDDPFYQRFSQVEEQCREASTYKEYSSYRVKTMIVKSNDDLRQEVLAI